MNSSRKSEPKRKRKYKGILIGNQFKSDECIPGEYIDKILNEITRKIPEITFDSTKIYNGVKITNEGLFDNILVLLGELSELFKSPIVFIEESNCLSTFDKTKSIFEKIVIWLSGNDSKILIKVIYSIPLIINILIKIKKQYINIRKRKKLCIEYSELSIVLKYVKKAIQIFSCLSISTEAKIRVACVYCTKLLIKLDEFEISIIEDAFLTPISPINYINSKMKENILVQGDTTDPELFVKSIPKFYEANSRQSFIHSFSILNFNRIYNNNGSNNDLFDKGWLSRRLDDESPAVRFEIFIMIYELIKIGKIKNSKDFLKSINEIVYDCFFDENIAIQSLISEIITILSEISPISINNINKVLPIINDSNIYTRYNIFKVISNSYFGNAEALHKALTAVLESPLLQFDEKLVFNVFSSTAIRNSIFAPEIIPILFEQYYVKEEEIYHASISIFLFWAIWKTPSIIKNINFDLLLLYPVAKFNFSSNIPDLRIRVSYESSYSLDFEVKPQFYNSNVLNYSLGLYPMKPQNKFINKNLLKKGLFVSIGNASSNDFLIDRTIMEMCLSGNSPIESLFQFSINNFTSNSYIMMKRNSFFYRLKTLISHLKIKTFSPRINALFNISSIRFQLGMKYSFHHLIKGDGIDINFSNKSKEIGNVNLPIYQYLWPVNSKYNSELCKIFDSKMLICSSFIISTPDVCGPTFSYFFENYVPKKNKNEKLCLLLGNLTHGLIEFRSLFCQCIVCKFNTYYQEGCPKYLDGSSKVIFSKTRDAILKKTGIKFYSFPFKVLQRIPISISFDVHPSPNIDKTSSDQNVNLFVQTPQALKFENPKINEFRVYENRKFLIKSSHSVLNELDSMNFESYNTANIYCQIDKSIPFTVVHSRKNDPIINYTIPLSVENRQSYVSPISKDTLRMSITDLIEIKFEYPIASPIAMNAVVICRKNVLASPISNIYPIIIHPNIMA